MSLAGMTITIKRLGTRGRHAEIVLPGDMPVTVQWGDDWLLVARDDPDSDDQHVVGVDMEQAKTLLAILQSFVATDDGN